MKKAAQFDRAALNTNGFAKAPVALATAPELASVVDRLRIHCGNPNTISIMWQPCATLARLAAMTGKDYVRVQVP